MPAKACDLGRDRVLVSTQDLAHLLGVETPGERRGADEVAKHQREPPSLRLGRDRRGARRGHHPCGRWTGQVADGPEHDLARPERQPELPQVGVGQLWQGLGRDLAGVERLHVALKSQAAQPGRNIHALHRHGHSRLPIVGQFTPNLDRARDATPHFR
jgi:hypothetical protein